MKPKVIDEKKIGDNDNEVLKRVQEKDSNPFELSESESEIINIEEEAHDPFSEVEENPFQLSEEAPEKVENLFEEITQEESPFKTEEQNWEKENFQNQENDYNQEDHFMEEDQPVKSNVIDHVVDPDTTYFFVFGLSSAGKSVMLSGLIYYLKAIRSGQLKSISDLNVINQKRGDFVMSQMRTRVRDGQWVEKSKMIEQAEFVFPSEINLEYIPLRSENKYTMPFCLLEMAGEDLAQIKLSDGGNKGGQLDERINAYLLNPNCDIAFVCVVDPDDPGESQEVIEQFIDYTEKIGRHESPVLLAISKWDKVRNDFNNDVDKYFSEVIPSLDKLTLSEEREYTKMGFSIGKVFEDDSYKFFPKDSEKLFKWMYEITTGVPYDQEINESLIGKMFSSIKSMFKK